MSDQDTQDDEEFCGRRWRITVESYLESIHVAAVDEEVKAVSLVVGETMSDDSPGIEIHECCGSTPNSEIQLTLEKCPLFKGVSLQTLNTILSRIQAVKADFGARLIGKSLLNRGLLIAKQLSSIRVIPSDTDDYFNQVAEVNIFAGAYLGEFYLPTLA